MNNNIDVVIIVIVVVVDVIIHATDVSPPDI